MTHCRLRGVDFWATSPVRKSFPPCAREFDLYSRPCRTVTRTSRADPFTGCTPSQRRRGGRRSMRSRRLDGRPQICKILATQRALVRRRRKIPTVAGPARPVTPSSPPAGALTRAQDHRPPRRRRPGRRRHGQLAALRADSSNCGADRARTGGARARCARFKTASCRSGPTRAPGRTTWCWQQ